MILKSCVNNDIGVVKATSGGMYERNFALAVKQEKMTEARKAELLVKIEKVATGEIGAFAGTESDIKVMPGESAEDLVIDLVVHAIKADENDETRMNVTYAACKSTIRNASREHLERTTQLMHSIIHSSTNFMRLPDGEE